MGFLTLRNQPPPVIAIFPFHPAPLMARLGKKAHLRSYHKIKALIPN